MESFPSKKNDGRKAELPEMKKSRKRERRREGSAEEEVGRK